MISFFTSLGALPGEPLMALAFAAGIGSGNGIAQGLPFFVAAALYLVSGFGIWFLKAPRNTTNEGGEDSESQ
jgi:hypothetical protein